MNERENKKKVMAGKMYAGTKYEHLDAKYRDKVIKHGMKETAKKNYGKPKHIDWPN